ncbi:LamB/YcsF family protein [Paenarthrobacter nitroguajacolicus]|uniref:LamB/YcsF family protein n=1 Tax=Paenarthrobacter nitroguajacolicus TaxID=211146 RepID=UPI00248B2B17|nr:5-oxoprolinase subunit PxpA [Paenarthrobacter nitroguajacolicus]MDI2034329.1 5-oxoprolinase subunit A [Paenarthrobacter nitroguajacolicus]
MDLNADLGESFGSWTMGDDASMFRIVSSANVACGFHAGDPLTMLDSCRAAFELDVRVGAHVGYRDLAGFGRRSLDMTFDELFGDVLYQLGALDGMAHAVGASVDYVKPHGALYNRIVRDAEQAEAVVAAVHAYDPGLPVLGLPGSAWITLAEEAGHPVFREAFVDRAYLPDGTLVPRTQEGAVLHDTAAVVAQAVRMATRQEVVAIDGSVVPVQADSLCIHGDTPGAVTMAAAVREGLEQAGVGIEAFA